MSTITKDLGAVTAYAYAVEQGYTGTEEEFAELMASYATVAEQAAESAAEAAESARTLQIDESLTKPGQAAAADKTGAVRDAFEALGMSVVDGKPCMTFLTDEEVEG